MDDDPFDQLEAVRDVMTQAEDVSLPERMNGPGQNVTSLDEYRNRPRTSGNQRADTEQRKSRFYSVAELEGRAVPERQWLVPDLIPSGTVTLLSGDGGTGKSLLALQLVAAAALGHPWLGRSMATGRALFVSAEDDQDELHRRLWDVAQAEGVTFADMDRLTVRSLAGEDALLAALDGRSGTLLPSSLYAELDAFLSELQPVVLVLDTLADLFPGNENDRAQARQFIGLMRGLAIKHQCAVVLLAHPSLSGMMSGAGTSGSTGWNNSVRARLYLRRIIQGEDEPNPDARILEAMKANYGPIGAEIALTWRRGVFVNDAPETGLDRMARNSKAQRVFLKLLRLFAEEGRTVNSGGGSTYAPTVFAQHPEAEGLTHAAFRHAMDRLFQSGSIVNVETGKPSRRRSHIHEAAK